MSHRYYHHIHKCVTVLKSRKEWIQLPPPLREHQLLWMQSNRLCVWNKSCNTSNKWWYGGKAQRWQVVAIQRGGGECVHSLPDMTLLLSTNQILRTWTHKQREGRKWKCTSQLRLSSNLVNISQIMTMRTNKLSLQALWHQNVTKQRSGIKTDMEGGQCCRTCTIIPCLKQDSHACILTAWWM